MRQRTKIVGLALLAGLGIGLTNFGPTRKACEIYQGRDTIDQNPTGYVFDPMEKDSRGEREPLVIDGDEDTVGELEIGRKYCFEYTIPIIGSQNPRNLRHIKPF